MRVWQDGKMLGKGRDLPGTGASGDRMVADLEASNEVLRLDRDFTAMVMFTAGKGDGTLISKSMPEGKWIENAKALIVRDGDVVYDIGWLGALDGAPIATARALDPPSTR